MATGNLNFEVDNDRCELHTTLGIEDWQEIVINKELHLHITSSADGGYVIDVYNYSTLDEPSEDDLVTSICVDSYVDLTRVIEVTVRDLDGSDMERELDDMYTMRGNKLLKDDEVIEEDITDIQDVIDTILMEEEGMQTLVTSITLDDEEIYRD